MSAEQADCEVACGAVDPEGLQLRSKEGEGNLRHDARAVAGASVRIDGAAVGHAAERLEGVRQERAARTSLDVRKKADAAGVLYLFVEADRPVEPIIPHGPLHPRYERMMAGSGPCVQHN